MDNVDFQIEMVRGDLRSKTFNLLTDSGSVLELEPEEIYFTVKNNSLNTKYRFQKRLSDGGIVKLATGKYMLTIEPEDTDDLDFVMYDCDIEIVRYNNPKLKRTFNGKLIINKESTHHCNEVVDG